MSFGSILKELRSGKNISRSTLADFLNIPYSTLTGYESDRRFPDRNIINAVANYFHVTTDYLLGQE